MVDIDYSVVTSWAVVIVISGVAYLYYTKKPAGRARGRSILKANNVTTGRGEPVKWDDSDLTGKASKTAKPKPARKPVKKTVQEVAEKAEAYLSGASTTGADADDDMSPAVSPSFGTTDKAPSGRDVSDMLAGGAAAPSVLRINPSEKPAQQKKSQPRPETPQETKKQRQNRKKAEEAKALREAEEKQRKVLEEKQRRTAREARGEPAKNGLQSAKAPTSNAWSAGRPAGAAAANPGAQLLDTFDPEVASTASSSEAGATNGTAPTPDSLSNLSEQEQLRMALEDSAWETVPKGKKQRKGKVVEEGTEEPIAAPAVKEAAPAKKPAVKQPELKTSRSGYDVLAPVTNATHPDDSDWPVV